MIKKISYRNKSILLKDNNVFVMKESISSDTDRLDLKSMKKFNTVREAIEDIDSEFLDEYELPTIVYQVITNPGMDDEYTEELTDLKLAQELFDGLKIDPDPSYKMIKFVKYDYDQDSEEILDFMDFEEEKEDEDKDSVRKEGLEESLLYSEADEKTQKNYDALSALSVLKHRIDLIYADFNLNPDTEKLKDDLKLISSTADKIIEDI